MVHGQAHLHRPLGRVHRGSHQRHPGLEEGVGIGVGGRRGRRAQVELPEVLLRGEDYELRGPVQGQIQESPAGLDGVAGLRVGIGSGSICSTSVVTRAGAPTLYATSRVADAVKKYGADIPIIADGGMRNPGDIAVAMAVGASCAMMGNVFAGCRESPGRLVAMEGRYYKEYYGMGSERARKKRYAQDRYSQPSKSISEGVEGWVPYRGPVKDILGEFTGGLKAAMGYVGAKTIPEMWEKAKLALITERGAQEAAPHDIMRPGPGRGL